MHRICCTLITIHPSHTSLQIVVLHTTRPRKVPRTSERRTGISRIRQPRKQSTWARARDAHARSLRGGLGHNAALVGVEVRLHAIRNAKVASIAAGLGACALGIAEVKECVLETKVVWGRGIAIGQSGHLRWDWCSTRCWKLALCSYHIVHERRTVKCGCAG